MWIWFLALLAFVAGFLLTWFSFDDIGTDVVFFDDDEELQKMHWNGLRNQ
jgi:hypothetical protein|tara:strand:+ start:1885 stop:2034 length:150 start_codon:yes stop_codon:yes gene_type:complete